MHWPGGKRGALAIHYRLSRRVRYVAEMTILRRALRTLAPLALLLPFPALAQAGMAYCSIPHTASDPQAAHARPQDPWIFRGTDIPVDPEWLMGELPNGVRYAVRRNGVPPCQISLRVVIDAGSLNETEAERGFAHLLEHMTFRQSRDFAPGEAIPYFQRLGAALGADTNATTSATQTIYKLDLPNANRTTLGDSVRLFSGMIREPVLSTANLAADVPIVLAERRDNSGPGQRIGDAMRETFFAGQLLARRDPIGTVETLQGATAQAVQAFHRRWYRPENAVVVLAGDADPQLLAALVEQHFGDWRVPGRPTPAPDFGDPAPPADALAGADGVPVGQASVIVEAGQPRTLTFAIQREWVGVVDNLEYNRGITLDSLAAQIINRRLENRARAGGSYLFARVSREKISRSVDGTYVTFTPLTEDWQQALADVRGVIADALAHPPSQAEIDREASEFEIAFVNMVEQARIQAGSELADSIAGALDIREAVATPDTFLALFRSMDDRLNPETVLAHTQRLFRGEVVRAAYLTGTPGEADVPALRAALAAPALADGSARDDGAVLDFAQLPAIGTPAAPLTRGPLGVPDVERLTFANGVNALIMGRDNEPGRVTVRVRFGGGWRAVRDDEGVEAQLGQLALVQAGVGPLDQNDLDRIAAGRKMGFSFSIDQGAFVFEAQTRREDLADQLWLFAAKLAMPAWDAAPLQRAVASGQLQYASMAASPAGVINRDLEFLLRGRDPRFAHPDPAMLAAVTPERFRAVWERLLGEGPVEVSVFGDIDRAATVEALSRTFGALAPRPALDAAAAARVPGFPAATPQPLRLEHAGDADQSALVIAWPTGGGADRIVESRKLELLAQIFANRLMDQLREQAGAAYSPIVRSDWPLDVAGGGHLLALVQIEPALAPNFYAMADRIAADLATNGPTADELARVVEPIKQFISRAQTGHAFWLAQLDGAAGDPRRVLGLRSLWRDFAEARPEEIREVAKRYLLGHGGFRVAVLPAGNSAPAPAVAGR